MQSFPAEDNIVRRWIIHHMESHQMFGRFLLNHETYHYHCVEWGFIKGLKAWTINITKLSLKAWKINNIKLTPSRIFIHVAAPLKRILTFDPLLIKTLPTMMSEILSLTTRVPLEAGQIVFDLMGEFFTRGFPEVIFLPFCTFWSILVFLLCDWCLEETSCQCVRGVAVPKSCAIVLLKWFFGSLVPGVDLPFLGNISSRTCKLSEVVFYNFHSYTQRGKPRPFFDM